MQRFLLLALLEFHTAFPGEQLWPTGNPDPLKAT
jgi:hypothetical protein